MTAGGACTAAAAAAAGRLTTTGTRCPCRMRGLMLEKLPRPHYCSALAQTASACEPCALHLLLKHSSSRLKITIDARATGLLVDRPGSLCDLTELARPWSLLHGRSSKLSARTRAHSDDERESPKLCRLHVVVAAARISAGTTTDSDRPMQAIA